jgi:ERCC4-type nuclease
VDIATRELASVPGISGAHARILVEGGFHGVESILEANVAELADIAGIGDAAAMILEAARGEVLRRRATGQSSPEEHVH